LLEFRESLAHLQTLSAAKLQRHFAGALDLTVPPVLLVAADEVIE